MTFKKEVKILFTHLMTVKRISYTQAMALLTYYRWKDRANTYTLKEFALAKSLSWEKAIEWMAEILDKAEA